MPMKDGSNLTGLPGYTPLPSSEERQQLREKAQEVLRRAQTSLEEAAAAFSTNPGLHTQFRDSPGPGDYAKAA